MPAPPPPGSRPGNGGNGTPGSIDWAGLGTDIGPGGTATRSVSFSPRSTFSTSARSSVSYSTSALAKRSSSFLLDVSSLCARSYDSSKTLLTSASTMARVSELSSLYLRIYSTGPRRCDMPRLATICHAVRVAESRS